MFPMCPPLLSHPQGLQEAEFLTCCSGSFSLVLQLSNTPPTPAQKGDCVIFFVSCQFTGERMAEGEIASLILVFAQGLGVGQCSWKLPVQKDISDEIYSDFLSLRQWKRACESWGIL